MCLCVVHFYSCKVWSQFCTTKIINNKNQCSKIVNLYFSLGKRVKYYMYVIKLGLQLRVTSWDYQKSKLHAVEVGFWVAKLRVQQVKLGPKSCFGLNIIPLKILPICFLKALMMLCGHQNKLCVGSMESQFTPILICRVTYNNKICLDLWCFVN